MKKRLSTILLILIFLIGLSLLLYPTVSDYWNSLHQSRAIAEYAEQVANLDDDLYEGLWSDAQRYNETLLDKADRYDMTEEERAEYFTSLSKPISTASLLSVSRCTILERVFVRKPSRRPSKCL